MERSIARNICLYIDSIHEEDDSRVHGFRSAAEEACYYVSKQAEVLSRAFLASSGYWPDENEDSNSEAEVELQPESTKPILDAFVLCNRTFNEMMRFAGLPSEEEENIRNRHFHRMEKAKLEAIVDLIETSTKWRKQNY